MLAAGDTFRAAAVEQLRTWGERNDVPVIAQEKGDPAAVVFDALQSAQARGIDLLIADTAGRLPTQLHLMEELKKVKRVIARVMPDAPHEVLLVLDANTGQNAVSQVKAFDDALGLTGLDDHQAGRHREGRRHRRHRALQADSGALHRRGRRHRRSAAVRRQASSSTRCSTEAGAACPPVAIATRRSRRP